MFSPIGRGWGKQKPPLGAGLLTGHPRAQGLVYLNLFNANAGLSTQDLVTGSVTALAFRFTAAWQPDGPYCPADTNFGQFPSNALLNTVTKQATFEALLRVDAPTVSNSNIFARTGGTTDVWWVSLQNGKLSLYANNITGGVYKQSTTVLPATAGLTYHLVVTYDGAAIAFYVNGIRAGTVAATGSFQTGNLYGTLANLAGFQGVYKKLAVYNRALAPGEVASLSDNPYQMIAPPAPWRLYSLAATGGGTLNATGIPTAQAATVLGAASVPLNAAGAASAGSAAAAGVASVPLNATGNPTAQSAVPTGAASVPLNASGSVSSQAATAAGAGTVSLPGLNADGAVTPGAAASAGLASIPLSALGYMTARPATAAGAVSIPVNAAGAVFALSASASGAGTIVQGPTVRRYYFVRAGRVYIVKGK